MSLEGSTLKFGVPEPPHLHSVFLTCWCLVDVLGAQQTHWLLLSPASETDLMVCRRAMPRISRSLSSLMVEEATNPLLPTSIGQTLVLEPCCFTSAASSVWCNFLCLQAFSASHTTASYSNVNYSNTVYTEYCFFYLSKRPGYIWSLPDTLKSVQQDISICMLSVEHIF